MNPRVSICVPNLNGLPFLKERFESILGQTYRDWELFVYDSFSDDGAWELIQKVATSDDRIRLAQGPRQGPYPAWNECLRRTKGEYVYIATSDDTMAPDCIEKMVDALDLNPSCDLAHCPLRVTDHEGRTYTKFNWPEVTMFAQGWPALVDQPHLRWAPHDGLLHLTGQHVYLSIAQLLIRRSLFSKIGEFPSKWGSISDFNWEMKAGLLANTIHVPTTWASWRIHLNQATLSEDFHSRERDEKIEEMIADAFHTCEPYLSTKVKQSTWWQMSKNLRMYYAFLRQCESAGGRRYYQLSKFFVGPAELRTEIIRRLRQKPKWPALAPNEIRRWFGAEDLGHVITLNP